MQVVVCDVGSQPDAPQDHHLPQRETFAALLRIGILKHVPGDQFQGLLAKVRLRIEMLQSAEHGDHTIPALHIQLDLFDRCTIQLQLISRGHSHARRASW